MNHQQQQILDYLREENRILHAQLGTRRLRFDDEQRIQGALSNLGHRVAHGTVANILKKHGIEPSPQRNRQTNWKEFLSHHWELLVAANVFTVEVWTRRGLQRFLVPFFIDLSSRRVKIAGIGVKAPTDCG